MNSETTTAADRQIKSQGKKKKNINRLKIAGAVFSVLGIGLFAYFVYSVGIGVVLKGISNIGIAGFVFILVLYLAKLSVRATAWRLSVYEPYKLEFSDTLPAVIIGEALSSMKEILPVITI